MKEGQKPENKQDNIALTDIVFILWKNRIKILIFFLIGAILGGSIFVVGNYIIGSDDKYVITTSFAVNSMNSAGHFSDSSSTPGYSDVQLSKELVEAAVYEAKSQTVLTETIDSLGLNSISVDKIKEQLTAEQQGDTQIIILKLKWNDEQEGIKIVSCLTDILSETLLSTLKIGVTSVVDEPSSKEAEPSISGIILVAAFGIVGFVIAIVYCIISLIFHPTFISVQDIEDILRLPVIGEIPTEKPIRKMVRNELIQCKQSSCSMAYNESIQSMSHIFNNLMVEEEQKMVYVSSATADEGKSTVAANLALGLAELDKKVLLVDLNMRAPVLDRFFLDSIPYEKNINKVVAGEIPISEAIFNVTDNLYLLPVVLTEQNLRINKKIISMIEEVSSDYDFVILDTSSIGLVADGMNLNSIASYVVFVVRQNHAWQEIVFDSVDRLEKSGAQILGCVLNGVDTMVPGNRFHKLYHGVIGNNDNNENSGSKPRVKAQSIKRWR